MRTVFCKQFGEPYNEFSRVIETSDGSIVAVGGGSKGIIVKLDSQGELVFTRSTGKVAQYNDVLIDVSGAIVAVGGGTISSGNSTITKLTSTGDVVFDKAFGSGTGGYFNRVVEDTNSGGYVAAGTDGSRPARARVAGFTSTGNLTFDRTFGTSVEFFDVTYGRSGAIVAVGGTNGTFEGQATIAILNRVGTVAFSQSQGAAAGWYRAVNFKSDILTFGGGAEVSDASPRLTRFLDDGTVVFDQQLATAPGTVVSVIETSKGDFGVVTDLRGRSSLVRVEANGKVSVDKQFDGSLYAVAASREGTLSAAGASTDGSGVAVTVDTNGKVQTFTADAPLGAAVISSAGVLYAATLDGSTLVGYRYDGVVTTINTYSPDGLPTPSKKARLTNLTLTSDGAGAIASAAAMGTFDGAPWLYKVSFD
ncbi:hypothetical protein [Nocardia sp. NPDC006630]|uniref:hypothetical protein n=1 Tax=Nocardia sp. NPDC006630 TaxID=3157181 RepID=UPI0033B7B79C